MLKHKIVDFFLSRVRDFRKIQAVTISLGYSFMPDYPHLGLKQDILRQKNL